MSSKISKVLITLLLILAAAIRLYRLNEGPWLDEILTSVLYGNLSFREIASSFNSENNHILYSLLARASLIIIGQNTWALRLPAVIFGVASLGALYLLGIQVSTKRETFFAVALLTFSYHHVWFSQNARGYTGLLFFTLISTWLLLRSLKNNQTSTWIFYGFTAALGIYTHLTMVFVLFGHGVAIIITILRQARKMDPVGWPGILTGVTSLAGFTILFFIPVLDQLGLTLTHEGRTAISTWANPFWTIQEMIRGLQIGFQSSFLVAGLLVCMGAGIWSFARSSPEFLAIALIPPFVGAAIVILLDHHLWPRFFFFSLGFMVLILFRGVITIIGFLAGIIHFSARFRFWMENTALTGLVLVSAFTVPAAFGPKQDYLGAYRYVQDRMQSNDAAATVGLSSFVYDRYFQTGWRSLETIEDLIKLRAGANRTWIVITLPIEAEDKYPTIMQQIKTNFTLEKKFYGTLNDGEIYIYASK